MDRTYYLNRLLTKTITVFFIVFSFLFLTKSSYAHVLVTDNNIGAVLHIDPNDQPLAGQQSGFFFDFKDRQNKFDPNNCTCTFIIDENGKQIFSQPLFQDNTKPNLENASVFFTFPRVDVYQVKVIGQPITPNAFQPFTLVWNWRVDQSSSGQSNKSPSNGVSIYLSVVGFIVLLVILFFISKNISLPKQKKGGEKND